MMYTKRFYPRKPVKTFQDLDVYQKTYGLGVEIVKKIKGNESKIAQNLRETVLEIPKQIASAHSIRFGRTAASVDALEEAMLLCNLAVLYLEEFRDIENPAKEQKEHIEDSLTIAHEFFMENIQEYLRVRTKIMRLQKAWLKFR